MNNFSSFGSFNILCDRAAGKTTSLLVRLQHLTQFIIPLQTAGIMILCINKEINYYHY